MSDVMPAGWPLERLGDVCEPISKKGPDESELYFRYIDLTSIDNDRKILLEAKTVATENAPSRAKQRVRAGDVLFSTVRVYLENICLVPNELDGEIASTAFCVLRPNAEMYSKYLYYYVASRPFVLAVNKLQRGNSPPSVQDGDIREQSIPLPARSQQIALADKIDELFSQIDEGECALKRVQTLVERYRQSVLNAAVTGELTRDWRARQKNQPAESGEALLQRILKARRVAWEKAELEKMAAKGKTPANDAWKKKYKAPIAPDTTQLPDLPEGWAWGTLDQLCSLITSGSRGWKRYYADSGSLFIRAQNIKYDSLDLTDIAFVDVSGVSEGTRTKVQEHDLLVTITGANVTKSARVQIPIDEGYVSQHVALARPTLPNLSAFIFHWVVSPANGRAKLMDAAYGAGKPGLSLTDLKELPVALPPLAEQAIICEHLEANLEALQRLSRDAIKQIHTAQQLRQATLKSAFSGRLVPKNSADKTASPRSVRTQITERAAD